MLCDTGPGYRKDAAREQWNDRAAATADRFERDVARGAGAAVPKLQAAGHGSALGLARAAPRHAGPARRPRHGRPAPPSTSPSWSWSVTGTSRSWAAADYMAAKIPKAAKAVIPDAGHASNIDQPAAFNQAVGGFLALL